MWLSPNRKLNTDITNITAELHIALNTAVCVWRVMMQSEAKQ